MANTKRKGTKKKPIRRATPKLPKFGAGSTLPVDVEAQKKQKKVNQAVQATTGVIDMANSFIPEPDIVNTVENTHGDSFSGIMQNAGELDNAAGEGVNSNAVAKDTLAMAGKGASTGASVGTMLGGPVGTVIGGVVGGVAGGIGGVFSGKSKEEDRIEDLKAQVEQAETRAEGVKLGNINSNLNNYHPMMREGGNLNAGRENPPGKLNTIPPKAIPLNPDGYIRKGNGTEPYFTGRDIKVPGYNRPLSGRIEDPTDPGKSVQSYSSTLQRIKDPQSTITSSQGEDRTLSYRSAMGRTAEVLNEDIMDVKSDRDAYFKRAVQEYPNQFSLDEDNLGNSSLREDMSTNKYDTKDVNGVEQKEFGGDIGGNNNGNPTIRQYKGETHDDGANGGIEVGSDGNPTSVTGKKGIALVENDEVSFDGYIFSNSIEYK
jgi:type II secretory pathway pseudopilin PulG